MGALSQFVRAPGVKTTCLERAPSLASGGAVKAQGAAMRLCPILDAQFRLHVGMARSLPDERF